MTDELTRVPTKRLQELLAKEAAYDEEHAGDDVPPSLAERFKSFCAARAQEDRERRGER